MVRCSFCGLEANEGYFRMLCEPWRFRFYTVKILECPRCRGIFNYYKGTSPRNKYSAFMIKIRPGR